MYLFIATHLGSGASFLCDSLSRHERCMRVRRSGYKHGTDLIKMKDGYSFAKIYFDKLVYNYQFSCPSLYNQCKFIYLVREASPTLNHLITYKGYSQRGAYLYYTYRLRRLCEMAKKTPNPIILTFDDLLTKRSFDTIQKNLGLRYSLEYTYKPDSIISGNFSYPLVEQAQERYDRHLAYLLALTKTTLGS